MKDLFLSLTKEGRVREPVGLSEQLSLLYDAAMIKDTGATHVILHEAAYRGGEGGETASVLQAAGAVELFRDGSDVLFLLSR